MDLLAELETMAVNVTEEEEMISDADVRRWQNLFGLTRLESSKAIETYHGDYSRARIADEHWDAVKSEQEAKGHNRESYEYSLTQTRKGTKLFSTPVERGSFIVQLAGPLDTAERIQEAAALSQVPPLATGSGEDGEAQFCEIDGAAKFRLLAWLAKHHGDFHPTIVRLSKAKKDLCSHTQAPMLAMELTLPQHRPYHASFEPTPLPDQYPVWYFFYGTLADPAVLSQHSNLDTSPSYIPAHVVGGRVRTWAGKYRALTDAPGEKVDGSAFLVESRDQEDALRFYETDKYEVVRCHITMQTGVVCGLTFRFNGAEHELD
ncbi:hypothetical protein PV05_02386 [Exophiala xenobiotica]|uniref:Putative gamma-glutamylcyclotransferase n=1 Tax=Exophiala xenobiotica TaxID=348802 RepID=A0A0D2FCM5_9EURO|nr:uncharacterized protein PV05_02386 [Exophiala xenobiotica]KIW57829.1 hypothetical protein PV05_02386 [Exophiala xenobiotica]